MRILSILIALILFSCKGNNEKIINQDEILLIESSNTNDHIERLENSLETQELIDVFCNNWILDKMYIVSIDGIKKEFNQGALSLEFKKDHTSITKMESMGITAEGTWEADSSFSSFTLEGISMNGEKLKEPTIQLNEIIQLNQNKFKYTYDDPITGMTLEMNFRKNEPQQ